MRTVEYWRDRAMKAEKELAEDIKQEPVATVTGIKTRSNDNYTVDGYEIDIQWLGKHMMECGQMLYASPIPVQVVVLDGQINFDVELPVIKMLLKKGGYDHEAQIAQQTLEYICALRRESNALKIITNCENTSPRITELDAREIAESYFNYRRNKTANNIGSGYQYWYKDEGHALLAKLNKE